MLTFGQIGFSVMVISVLVMGGAFCSQHSNDEEDKDLPMYLGVTFVLYWVGVILFGFAVTKAYPDLSLLAYYVSAALAEIAATIASFHFLRFIFKIFGLKQSVKGGK